MSLSHVAVDRTLAKTNRNARRKRPGDLLWAWKIFLDRLKETEGHKRNKEKTSRTTECMSYKKCISSMVPCMGDEETEETKRKKTNTGNAKECNTNEEKKRCSAGIIYYPNLPWGDHYLILVR